MSTGQKWAQLEKEYLQSDCTSYTKIWMAGGKGGDLSAHKRILLIFTKLKTVKKRLSNCPHLPSHKKRRNLFLFRRSAILLDIFRPWIEIIVGRTERDFVIESSVENVMSVRRFGLNLHLMSHILWHLFSPSLTGLSCHKKIICARWSGLSLWLDFSFCKFGHVYDSWSYEPTNEVRDTRSGSCVGRAVMW